MNTPLTLSETVWFARESLTPLQVVGSTVWWFVRLQFLKTEKGKLLPVHTVKIYGGSRVYLHSFLIPAFDGGECSISRLGLFIPKTLRQGENPYTLWQEAGWAWTFWRRENKNHCCSPFDTHTHTRITSFRIRTGRIFSLLFSEIKNIFFFTAWPAFESMKTLPCWTSKADV
jgi:hypothetical protein